MDRRTTSYHASGGNIALRSMGLGVHPIEDLHHFLVTTTWSRFLAVIIGLYLVVNGAFAVLYVATGAEIRGAEPGSLFDAFSFSVQTLSTIGYGDLSPGDRLADTLVAVESVVGILGAAFATGLAFARFSRPRSRMRFSKRATISRRDGIPSLMFRVGNERGNRILDGRMRAMLTHLERTPEGELVRRFHSLPLVRADNPMFLLVWQGTHPIDMESPLFGKTRESFAAEDWQIFVTVQGIDADLGQPIQSHHAYGPDDICWGARLADMFRELEGGGRALDFQAFDEVVDAPMP